MLSSLKGLLHFIDTAYLFTPIPRSSCESQLVYDFSGTPWYCCSRASLPRNSIWRPSEFFTVCMLTSNCIISNPRLLLSSIYIATAYFKSPFGWPTSETFETWTHNPCPPQQFFHCSSSIQMLKPKTQKSPLTSPPPMIMKSITRYY